MHAHTQKHTQTPIQTHVCMHAHAHTYIHNTHTHTHTQIRNIYRLVAFIQQSVAEDTDTGGSGKSAGEIEPVFFIFEALMILLSIIPFAVYPPSFLLPRASAKKAEKRGQSSECIDSEKNEDEKEDLRADVPEFYRQYVLGPFERYPWLGKVF